MKATEGVFDDSVVYVTKQGTQVGVQGGRIVVRDLNDESAPSQTHESPTESSQSGVEVLATFPREQVDTVNVFGGVNFTTPFLARASTDGIVLNYFSQHGQYRGSFVPEQNTIAEVRRAQYALSTAAELALAKSMIAAKIRNARTVLGRKGVRGTDTLRELGEKVTHVNSKDELRGVEGDAAARYFSRLDETLADGWTFETRTTRPPEDHINSLLSLTYVFMKNEVLSALRQLNLDPFLGVFHADRHGRPSLALDLLEEFRPAFCDTFVTRLINRGTITHDDFRRDNHLNDDVFSTYAEKFDSYMEEAFTHPYFDYRVTRREAIRQQTILLRKAITGELDNYHALEFDH
ncbi:CRISPR-associated endonuclease Cas1 [Haloferax sp. Atlit-19N]|uniref:CRISPR-associated endonuclease Cas1 n=1 Tax=Haloferax sp. Atlit-19N TaxID=2077201 RepID=UPI000E22EC93|nr:CRISPR-associated endonuclease Cas1 [Haloferax sp. Atlit-19N]RDZ43726.1 CRISPR-associated endonuclease Cas1 [Haloferax sp. Atlit-19N]